jgi:NADH dehydrogenase
VKAPDVLADIAGLETNRLNQLVVRGTLQTTRDDAIFAIGDCAACPWPGHDHPVPPRAQAAHQQASHLAKQLPRRLAGEPLAEWRYRDLGSLVSLGNYSTVGSLMGKLIGGNLFIEGCVRRPDVQVALQDAPAGAARAHQGVARHRRPADHRGAPSRT